MKNINMSEIFAKKASPFVKHFLPQIEKGFALDIGCAGSANCLMLNDIGFKVSGVDLKLPEVAGDFPDIDFHEKSIMDFEFEASHFSLILALNVLHFFPYSAKYALLDKVLNSLKPGGYLLLQSFTTEDPGFRKISAEGGDEIEPNSFYFKNRDRYMSYFGKGELDIWLKNQPLEKVLLQEEIIDDNHPPLGFHHHGVIDFVAVKN